MAGVPPEQARRWRAARWNLMRPACGLSEAVAANPPFPCCVTAYLSAAARADGFRPRALEEMVFESRALRIFPHERLGDLLVPVESLPALYAAARFTSRARRTKRGREREERFQRAWPALAERIGHAPRTMAAIAAQEGRLAPFGLGSPRDFCEVLDRAGARGLLVKGRRTRSLAQNEATYALPSREDVIPAARDSDFGFLEALALDYFRFAGPATRDDFAWWAGVGFSAARRTIEDLAGAIEEIDLAGERHAHFMLEEDAADLRERPVAVSARAVLLPPDDPAAASRMSGLAAIADARYLGRLQPGARASPGRSLPPIVLAGSAVGWWSWQSIAGAEAHLLRELDNAADRAVQEAVGLATSFIESELAGLPRGVIVARGSRTEYWKP